MSVTLAFGRRESVANIHGDDLHRLYHEALTGSFHDEVLNFVADRMPGAAVLLVAQDTVDHSGNYLDHRGLDIDAIRSFSVDISADCNWFRKQWQQPVGAVFRQVDLLDTEDFKTTRFYRNWLSARGQVELAVGTVFMRKGTRQHVLEIRYSASQERDFAPLAQKLLTELSPHLMNAARTADMRTQLGEADRARAQTLALIPFPTAIVDAECKVVDINPRAEQLIRSCKAIILGADERLHGIEPDSDTCLKAAVEDVASGLSSEIKWLRFNRTERQRSMLLTLVRMDPLHSNRGARDNVIRSGNHNRVAVIAHLRGGQARLSHDMLWQTFGLTSKESELAAALVQGDSIGDIAQKNCQSKQTLRNQLGAVMRKTGTNRQVDLVVALLRLSLSSPA